MNDVLILFYSRHGATANLARQIARGVESAGLQACLRQVPPVVAANQGGTPSVPGHGAPFVEKRDLEECSALILGSPTRFGIMAAPLKHFLDSTGAEWISGTLVDKPGAVFTSTSTQHGGQESTLLGLALPLLHHGMLLVGIPFTESALNHTAEGGTPYGASHVDGPDGGRPLSTDECELARKLGQRVALFAQRLRSGR